MSGDIRPLPGVRWRHVAKFLGRAAVAYDLPKIGGGRATLYVVAGNIAGLPANPPQMPGLSTGGKSVAAWQAGDLVYVFVVEGDERTYGDYLDQSRGPLT